MVGIATGAHKRLGDFPAILARVAGQVEDQNGQERDAHAGYDQVDRVEERLPAERQVEHYVQIRLLAAAVELLVPHRRHTHDVPLHGDVVVLQVDAHLDVVRVGGLLQVPQVHLEKIR